MTRSISSNPQPLRHSPSSPSSLTEKALQVHTAMQPVNLKNASAFTRNRQHDQAKQVNADKSPFDWVRRHVGQPGTSAAHNMRPSGYNERETINSQQVQIESPVIYRTRSFPLAPIPNLHPGNSPHRAPGVRTYMTGWNYNDPIREQTPLVYAPQPYPPGVFPVGVNPKDPLIMHF